MQRNLEDVQSALFPERILLCDRGTLDGAAYWPDEENTGAFFNDISSTYDKELARYDTVIFFESAAVGGDSIEGNNPVRIESRDAAIALDTKLREIWAKHPRFFLVPHNPSFVKKIMFGLAVLESIVAQHDRKAR